MPGSRRIGTIEGVGGSHRCGCCALLTAALVVVQGGCASDRGSDSDIASRTVRVEEFSAPPASSKPASSTAPANPAHAAATRAAQTPATAPTDAASPSPSRDRAAARTLEPGDETVVESVIGQVSGRPIFADEFLEPIADQLRSEAERLSQDAFMERARVIIDRQISQVILNELFLAEAEASLTPQEQMGLLAFLKDLQEKSIAERGGTIFGASRRIAEEQEMTLEEFEEAQKNTTLIQKLLYERVAPRVIVSWRDVQREYELRRAEFNPPATVTLRRLQLRTADQKGPIDQVRQRLADGASFDAIVSELSLDEFVSPVGQDGRFVLPPGGLESLEVADVLRMALAKLELSPGQTTQAIERGGDTLWLNIHAIEQPPPRSLFDVQEQLVGELQARRFDEERNKYINSLLQKGIFDAKEEMTRRVLAVALLRYGR